MPRLRPRGRDHACGDDHHRSAPHGDASRHHNHHRCGRARVPHPAARHDCRFGRGLSGPSCPGDQDPQQLQSASQTGLNEADIVYEEIVNDRITRFAAVFHSQGSEPVGPIRSGRAQDIDLLSNLNGPLYAWSGGNDGVTRLVRASTFVDLDGRYTSGYYRRDGRGGAPHNLFSSTEALWSHTPDDFTTPVPVFPYLLPGETINGDPGTSVEVTMDRVDALWGWDPNRGSYFRWQEGDPHMTELTGQVSTENVVIMFVDYISGVVDARSPEAQTAGTGRVIVLSEGIAREGIWTRPTSTRRGSSTPTTPAPPASRSHRAGPGWSCPATILRTSS